MFVLDRLSRLVDEAVALARQMEAAHWWLVWYQPGLPGSVWWEEPSKEEEDQQAIEQTGREWWEEHRRR